MASQTVTDGSSPNDAPDPVRIDRSDAAERYRYRCPNGHVDWSPTNCHAWCRGCRRQAEAGDNVDPEWYKLVDEMTGQEIPWSAVELVEGRDAPPWA